MAEGIVGRNIVAADEQGQADDDAGHQHDAQEGLELGVGKVDPGGGASPGKEVQAEVDPADQHEEHRDPLQQGAVEVAETGVVG